MIGNDVVDLQLAAVQSNWRKKGFLTKVFSSEEQRIIETAAETDERVWLLWSMKEAAYKAHQRTFQLPRKLNWLAQECTSVKIIGGRAFGKVSIDQSCYFTTSEITPERIHTVAKNLPKKNVKSDILETSRDEIKIGLLREISVTQGFDLSSLLLEKDAQGIPSILYKKKTLPISFSLSAHGRYAAYSLAVNDV